MRFNPEHYLEASLERLEDARILYNEKRYAASIYFSGVAVECLLRAYRMRKDPSFDSRHNLGDLVQASSVTEFLIPQDRRTFGVAFGELWRRWKNDYRYASEYRLKSELRRLHLHVGVKGDFVKYNSMVAFNTAQDIVTLGVNRWG